MAEGDARYVEFEGRSESPAAGSADEVDPEHIQDILNEIQRLHKITTRDGDLFDKNELRNGHKAQMEQEGRRRRLRRQRSSSSRDRGGTPVNQQPPRQENANPNSFSNCSLNRVSFIFGFSIILFICVGTPIVNKFFEYVLGVRCFVPNNYLVWEATRPKSDCSFCEGLEGPIVLPNMTRAQFSPYAYSSAPIILKNAVSHWPAVTLLNYTYLKELYLKTPGALESVNEDCQFLHFKSNFMTLSQVFEMSDARSQMKDGEQPWYIGWSNCHPGVLAELRKLYPRPHFLPLDAEMPNTDFIFLGWEQGAVMHLDYIPRLMWQAQLRGRKHWMLAPTPECDTKCKSFAFFVEAGDAILVDTRLWYHGTHVSKGEFSLTVQSEYG